MSEIAKIIGQRVRNYRIDKGLSQEKLAELSGCHPTYIGQVERGEKNATLESIEKIASAMNVSLAQLFEKIGESSADSYPMKCYELVAAKSKSEQEHLYKMLVEMDKYKTQIASSSWTPSGRKLGLPQPLRLRKQCQGMLQRVLLECSTPDSSSEGC